ncbi:single-stranded DNA-binding protein [Brevundimonas diminuta]|uniref:single-stranded DNA-binding protein n=1 Tax=Brevundimonas diminuta TaxID=293 RepID=UPI0028A5AE32|nr:single-stranded DNA-binding protein [Brevundimonas diminuta]
MQTFMLEGYLVAAPSVLTAKDSGRKRAHFRVLETTRFRRSDGALGERTTGFNCVCFNEATAENYIAPFARKGSRVVIQGHLENDNWTDKQGVEHYDLRLIVDDIRLKNRRDRPAAAVEVVHGEALDAPDGASLDDDIPF